MIIKALFISSVTLSLAAFSLVGCGDSGADRSAATIQANTTVTVDVTKSKQELDKVQNALKGMRDASDSANLKKLYADLKDHTAELDSSLSNVRSSADSAVAAGKSQASVWHQQADGFTDPGLRAASNKREGDLRQAVDDLETSGKTFKAASDSYKSQIGQLLTALDLDLSQQGVQSVKTVADKIVDDEPNLRSTLSDVSTKSKAVNTLLNP
jgi:hypothetical protein